MSDETQTRNTVEVLGEEFVARRRAGEAVTIDEYANLHPELSDEIRRLFRTMLAMERFKVCGLSSGSLSPRASFEVAELQQLGDYQIVREIGRGGMGVVYEAEQQSLCRRVALKVFSKQAFGDGEGRQPFHLEAQTAGRLHHTNIVPVFDVGEQEGWHYFVMQQIAGISLDQYIAGETSTLLPDRTGPALWQWVASVGIQVADAIAYAHSQGIVHRDIKPSNLLLDAKGMIWVTDFGLAVTMPDEDPANQAAIAGTLRYMSPEHLGGYQGTSCDIYSLGLTLYELLTKRPAFVAGSRVQYVEKIMKGDMQRPRTIRADIPRDLEAIVLKAVSRDPERRYPSAADMADDLRRFVDGRPVVARPLSRLGRAVRWTKRNPAVASLSTALLLVVLTSLVLVSVKWREAVAENHRAESNLSLALESMDQILARFASSWMARPSTTESGGEKTGTEVDFQVAVSDHNAAVLQDALKFYDQFAEQNATSAELQRDTAKVHRRVGDIYERLGQYEKAERAYHRSLTILAAQPFDGDLELAIQRANTMSQLGLTMHATSQFAEAKRLFEDAKSITSDVKYLSDPQCQAELARICNNLGQTLWLMQRFEAAKQNHRQAISILEYLVAEYPENTEYRVALAHGYRIYYSCIVNSREKEGPDAIRSAGIAILEQLVSDFPNVPDYRCELSEMLASTSSYRRGEKNRDEQVKRLDRAVAIARQLALEHPSIPRYRAVLARNLKELAQAHRRTSRHESHELYLEAVSIYRTLAHEFTGIPVYHLLFAMILKEHADNLDKLDRGEEARLAIEEGIQEQQAFNQLRPSSHFGKIMLKRLMADLAKPRVPRAASNADDSP